ncbi:hypothetical protein CR152_28495 [Massilia violaceinigra]|uniref:PepSY domain-containing protein n=1 Tax=Massilia violaceinigra TaxID=2045208 RepID=A0A2D2DSQ1_9BURK|nr:hypothetical protein [Massilia violaceinigra]ATQ78009.1 hypothetical protein CR152_28495 [Massilia violaceinigra]
MKTTFSLLVLMAACASLPSPAAAHDDDPRGAKPRIGLISNDVALQRLRAAGVPGATVIKREQGVIVLRASIDGKPVTVHMDALNGNMVDPGNPARRIATPGIGRLPPMVSVPQLRVPRARLSEPDLMREAAAPAPALEK